MKKKKMRRKMMRMMIMMMIEDDDDDEARMEKGKDGKLLRSRLMHGRLEKSREI